MISNGTWSLDGEVNRYNTEGYRRESNLEGEFLYLQGQGLFDTLEYFFCTIEDIQENYADKYFEFDNLNFMLYYFSVEFSKLKIKIL